MKRFLLPGFILVLLCSCALQPEITPTLPPVRYIPAADWWQPSPGLSWQWQLDGEIDTSIPTQVYDLDLEVEQEVIDELHARGVRVICYISVGSFENWRPDADLFPPEVLGRNYAGWPGEKWLDIRRTDLLAPIMLRRLDLCASKGFDGIEPDNMEVIGNDTGFPLTYQDQFTYASWLAAEAHARGLAIGMKNASEMVPDALAYFDFAITEDAFYYGWMEAMLPFIEAGKPVFAAEYTDMDVDFDAACAWGDQHRVSFILKDRSLDSFLRSCP